EKDGYIKIDAYKMGLAGVYLGVGRNVTTDPVCAEAGMILSCIEGDKVQKGQLIMDVYGKDDSCMSQALDLINQAVTYSDTKPAANKLIIEEIR
nr:thymidine phosphorylase [Treponema sp.]